MKKPKKVSKTREKQVLVFIEKRGRVRKSELVWEFVDKKNLNDRTKMSKNALNNILDRLVKYKLVDLDEVKRGGRKQVYFQSIGKEIAEKISSFVREYKIEEGTDPTMDDIAIHVGLPPEEIKKPLYQIAKEIEWKDPQLVKPESTKALKRKIFGGSQRQTDPEQISFLINQLKDPHLKYYTLRSLSDISHRRDVVSNKEVVEIDGDLLINEKDETNLHNLLHIAQNIVVLYNYDGKQGTKAFLNAYEKLLNSLYTLLADKHVSFEQRENALAMLGREKDKRLKEFISISLRDATTKEDLKILERFTSNLVIRHFLKEYQTELLKNLFTFLRKTKDERIKLEDKLNSIKEISEKKALEETLNLMDEKLRHAETILSVVMTL